MSAIYYWAVWLQKGTANINVTSFPLIFIKVLLFTHSLSKYLDTRNWVVSMAPQLAKIKRNVS